MGQQVLGATKEQQKTSMVANIDFLEKFQQSRQPATEMFGVIGLDTRII